MRILSSICLAFLAFLTLNLSPSAQAAESEPVKSGRAVAQLVTSYDSVEPGQEIYIALSMRLEPHWHTYWRNAGGPGEPAELHWNLPDSVTIGEIIWPLPQTVSTGPLINYAFEDRLLLSMPMRISKDAKPGDVLTIKAQATYLVCYQICLPEMAELVLELPIGAPVKDDRWSGNIERTIKRAPKPEGLQASARLKNGVLNLDIGGGELDFAAIKNPYFFPYEQDLIDASAPQNIGSAERGVRLNLTPSFGLEDGLKDIPGVLAFEEKTENGWTRRGIEVLVVAGAKIDIGAVQNASGRGAIHASAGLLATLLGAFIGGMILNLMPCVFPVLSLKVLGFARAAHDERNVIRAHGWLYALGVMLSFLALAAVILALKAGGASVGWGFQLQNPVLVGALALLFFVIAMNLFGFFDIGGHLQNTGSGLATSGGYKGAFFTGVLAVIVATPCTAPFMAGALGFAFAQSAVTTLLIFIALGAGFALPFLALSYAPALLKRLPKPGPWMDVFKQFLAFPMLGAAVWLIWVLSVQTGADGVLRVTGAMLLLGFAIWLWKRKGVFAKILLAVSVLTSGYLVYNLRVATYEQGLAELPKAQAWSPERVAQLRSEGKIVFVNFTAAWCVSCKVNDKLVLQRRATIELFARTNTVMLIADWTRRDDRITAELTRHGRSGVPLYLVYPPGTHKVDPQLLPQVLSYKTLEKALAKVRIIRP
ncbi:MAG: thiol:disulfide interchange protein [Robiginitomaculum sp.]|nr:MAG: thiol:disulfide interchange protein [Robiginitomaculum sp.]